MLQPGPHPERAERVIVRLEPELRAALVARALAEDTDATEIIHQALRAWLWAR
jgi:hypothetical protein